MLKRYNLKYNNIFLQYKRTVITSLVDVVRTLTFITKVAVTGYPVKKFTHTVLKNPFEAQNNSELQMVYNYYKMNANNLYVHKPCDRILLSFIVTRCFSEVVHELPHIFYHTKKEKSRLHILPSENYFNPNDYKAGDAVVLTTGEHIEFKTRKNLTTNSSYKICNQFKNVNLSENPITLSVLYNDMVIDFDRELYLNVLAETGFQRNKIHLISNEECTSLFQTLDSLEETLDHYNIKWSLYVQEHNMNMNIKNHLERVIKYSHQEDMTKKARHYLEVLIAVQEGKGTTVNPKALLKSIKNFDGF